MAVIANNVYFTHERVAEKNYALNGVNMNVPVGSIYGLLGPSGCGKTTLLKCIIGLLRPNFGNISVFGYKPGDERSGIPGGGIGYMPQELAIQYDLTIEEIFTYFGKLNFMETERLSNEIDYLVKTLDLWDKRRLIGRLSGGQKRRVSLAIAMLHKPRLLILDEPTVGVDPILSEVIWNLLTTLSLTLKTTIIITTHYIDETKRANYVAFMRKGFILEENNPRTLLKKYEVQCLDDVFLKLCVVQRQHRKNPNCPPIECKLKSDPQTSSVRMPYRPTATSNLKRSIRILYAIVWKFMIETRRNPYAIVLVLITTMSIVFAVKIVIGQTPRDIPVAWVVDEPFNYSYYSHHSLTTVIYSEIENVNTESRNYNTSYLNNSKSFVTADNYSETEETATIENNSEDYEELYLPDLLKKSINGNIVKLIEYSNISSALRDAKKTIVRGIIHLKSNFSRSFLECDPIFAEVDEYVSDDTLDSGLIHVYLDFTNLVIGQTIRAVIESSVQPFRKYIGNHFSINQNSLSLPVIIQPINFEEDRYITSVEDVFSSATFIAPGIVVFNSFGVCIAMCILSLLTPVECDMVVRDYSAGVKPVHTVLGQVIARFIFMFFNAILNLFSIVYLLNVPCKGSVALILILMWMQMILGLNIGVLMSSSMTSSYYSLYTALAITMGMFASNGIIWGIEAQPYYIKWLMQYSPLYYSSNALRAMLGYSNASFHVIWPGFAMTTVWTVVAFFAAVRIITLKK